MSPRKLGVVAVAALSGTALGSGPDVTLQDVTDVFNAGVVGTIAGFAIGSATCNIGDQNLIWASSGTPALAMNAYRLKDGRLMQIGLGNCKTACCAAAGSGCGTCNGQGGSVLGAGCRDVYGGGFNAGQTRLAPRSSINAFSGAFSGFAALSGDAIFRRLQVRTADLDPVQNPGALWFVEGVYVGSDDASSHNGLNNATYKRVTTTSSTMTVVTASQQSTIPAIRAWRDHGLGINVPDPSVIVSTVDVPAEGRFWYASKVTDLGGGHWRYDYAVFNLNSDRSGGSFSVPIPNGAAVSNAGFNAPPYHSNEVYSNTPWTLTSGCTSVAWNSPETFAQNPNSNALRWGTMYNFWFESDAGPGTVSAALGLFKPSTTQAVSFDVQGPAVSPIVCYANCDQSTAQPVLDVADFACFLNQFAAGHCYANCDGSTNAPTLTVGDFGCFINRFATGCP
jgi:hypothetical protein